MKNKTIKFIDLFAGLGGIRLGFEKAFKDVGMETECVMTSEIKPYAVKTLKHNFKNDFLAGDIFDIRNEFIPDFDFLLGGFPCQPFSSGGKRQGFLDTRGTLFFEIERILRDKKPSGFILENVEGLVKHDLENKNDEIGRTLKTILHILEVDLNYKVSWKVFDSLEFGLPQSRKRIFIVGTKKKKIDLNGFEPVFNPLESVLEKGLPEGVILNVNFPKLSKEDIKGIKICRQAKAMWQEEFDKRTNPQGKEYYWLTGKFVNQDKGTDTDEWALENGYISIVPVQFDLTAHHAIQQLNAWDL